MYKKWNEEFDVPEFDTDMVVDEMEPMVKNGGVVVDFHSCDFFPERSFFEVLFVDGSIWLFW